MPFGLFKRKDPVCGMREKKGSGFTDEKNSNWFCSKQCQDQFDSAMRTHKKKMQKQEGCCPK